ncbi:MAG: hypothetical protein IKD25_04195 [Bacteroidaceae bacterium]|nr:hypothetical protein [Bacteroidaceae bacterium]
MKKINLLMAAGLMSFATVQAQTTIASVGFEPGDSKYTTEDALTPGGTYGDWVNVKDGDYWDEQCNGDQVTGEYSLRAENDPTVEGYSWDRGFKIGNLPIKENTPYRVSFWIKADEPSYIDENGAEKNTALTAWLSKGMENYDKSFSSPSGRNYGVQMTSGLTGEWQRISFVSYYANAAVLDNIIANQEWVGNSVFPESMGGDGTQTYAQYFGGHLPEKYFVVVNMYSPVSYMLDDLKVEEGVTFNEATFSGNVVKLDFGYPTNIAALAKANKGAVSLPVECASVTQNGTPLTVEFVEGKEDGFLYVFLTEDVQFEEADDVKVSFTPAADCPIIYSTDARPSSDVESEMKVLGFADEKAWSIEEINVFPSAWTPAKLVSSTPENESFEIDVETFNKISLTFDKAVDLTYASAMLEKNGVFINLTKAMTLSEDGKTINIAVSGLGDGEYELTVGGVVNTFGVDCEGDIVLTFALGKDADTSVSESVYSTNETFAATANGTFPVGWVADDNGTIHEYGLTDAGEVWNYNWGGNLGGGGSRAMTGYSGDLNGGAIYWRNFNGSNTLGTLTFGEQVKDYMLADGTLDPAMPEGLSLYLDARKYQITIRMCAWKNLNGNKDKFNEENAPKYSFTLEDLEGNVYARFDDVIAMPNVHGNNPADHADPSNYPDGNVTNVTRSQTDFTVDKAGYYVLRFSTTQPSAELLLGGVDLITMPSKAAYWKQQLAAAIEEAKPAMDAAYGTDYDGDTKTAFSAALAKAEAGGFNTPSAITAVINELKDLAAKLTTRVNNIDDYTIYVIEGSTTYESLAEKYLASQVAVDAKKVLDQYAAINPSTLSDEELSEAVPLLQKTVNAINNLEANAGLLTWGITKGIETYNKLATQNEAALNAAVAAATDDRAVANNLNAANKLRVLQILANELVNGQIPEAYLTKVNEREEYDEYDEPTGNMICDVIGIELTGCVQNPKFYREYGVDGIPGWALEAGSDSTSLNIAYGGTAPSVDTPVTDQEINIYGNADYNLYQTLENLPAGIYTIKFSTRTPLVDKTADYGKIFYYNAQNDETGEWDKYIYAGSAVEPYKGGSWGYGNESNNTMIENVQVGEDGTLLIGAREHYSSGKAEKHEDNTPQSFWTGTTMCDNVRIFLVAPLEGYDYAQAAKDMEVSIDAVENEAEAKVITGIYNINGAQVSSIQKGVNLVKFSDGSVKKVLVK